MTEVDIIWGNEAYLQTDQRIVFVDSAGHTDLATEINAKNMRERALLSVALYQQMSRQRAMSVVTLTF